MSKKLWLTATLECGCGETQVLVVYDRPGEKDYIELALDHGGVGARYLLDIGAVEVGQASEALLEAIIQNREPRSCAFLAGQKLEIL